ncbi:N-acetylglucosaminyl transferase component family protein [Cryptosporidium muris RN66]|uniref:N-acetylglucosaminyl transferase component family protein n=1 Tax=Cryptosporidium muris (strain RN66) TaxID=441375 RepID=B6A9N8_CRYMR|nr:N-acetylglucosaminyl transferase component family protein [Cryptosporidium muris RN66]EEA04929.1 N-acetylglucosaminyl transferase component family protein [Cryptosporidium muris RN66]|eukprot:XP_002139278.1 N-acetylglucosaminyl transferase component family protein [Cryptosporidium muris RN66]
MTIIKCQTKISLLFDVELIYKIRSLCYKTGILLGYYDIWNNSEVVLSIKVISSINHISTDKWSNNLVILGIFTLDINGTEFSDYSYDYIRASSLLCSNILLLLNIKLDATNSEDLVSVTDISKFIDRDISPQSIKIIVYSYKFSMLTNFVKSFEIAHKDLYNAINQLKQKGNLDSLKQNSNILENKVSDKDLSLFDYYKYQMTRSTNTYFEKQYQSRNNLHKNDFQFPIFKVFFIFWITITSFIPYSLLIFGSKFRNCYPFTNKNLSMTLKGIAYKFNTQSQWIVLYNILIINYDNFNHNYDAIKVLLYSTITSIIIDHIFGVLLIYIINSFSMQILQFISKVYYFLYNDAIYLQFNWLASSELRLNKDLSSFLISLLFEAFQLWKSITNYIFSDIELIFFFLKLLSAVGGFSIAISFVWDIFNIYIFILHYIYVLFSKLHCINIQAISTFYHLFRGKKWNILRNRVDSTINNIEQLLFGTILFTISIFLYPTVAIFYVNFLFIWVPVFLINILFYMIIYIASHFPYFLTTMYFIYPDHFNSGLYLKSIGSNYKNQIVLTFFTKYPPTSPVFKFFFLEMCSDIQNKLNISHLLKYIFTGQILYILGSYNPFEYKGFDYSVCHTSKFICNSLYSEIPFNVFVDLFIKLVNTTNSTF